MIQEEQIHTHTLPNGLRIICAPSRSEAVYCGIAIDAGTRDEMPGESGMAHFAEHMSFKGTERLSARQVINRMESVGGDLNAYTGKEETVYYCSCMAQHIDRAIDLLLDITLHSTYPQSEMDREVEVIIDEIDSYLDQPSELIFDEFEELSFAGHPLGRSILGEKERLRQLTSADMKAFCRRLYRPERMVLYVYGNVSPERVISLAEKALESHGEPELSLPPAPRQEPAFHLPETPLQKRQKNTHQAHVVLGARSFSGHDTRHTQLFLLNNLLGGPCMSSRLNLSLRERHGLVYTVESNANCYSDTGLWTVYFGCDPCDVSRCCHLVRKELQKLTDSPLSQRTLDAARRQLKGQISISYDNFESVALGMAKRYLHYGKTYSIRQTFRTLDAITPQQLWETAQETFREERLLTLVYE